MIELNGYKDHLHGKTQQTFADGHVGGCNIYGDPTSECPKMWAFICNRLNITSVIDIGCGFGYHTKYFKEQLDLRVVGVEGSKKVVKLTPIKEVIHHDYTQAEYIPDDDFDLAWCIEFVEHVEDQYKDNFLATFKKCKHLVMTHATPGQSGYHHVNERDRSYWIEYISKNGFEFLPDLTEKCGEISKEDLEDLRIWLQGDDGSYRGPSAEAWKSNGLLGGGDGEPWFHKNCLVFRNINLT